MHFLLIIFSSQWNGTLCVWCKLLFLVVYCINIDNKYSSWHFIFLKNQRFKNMICFTLSAGLSGTKMAVSSNSLTDLKSLMVTLYWNSTRNVTHGLWKLINWLRPRNVWMWSPAVRVVMKIKGIPIVVCHFECPEISSHNADLVCSGH